MFLNLVTLFPTTDCHHQEPSNKMLQLLVMLATGIFWIALIYCQQERTRTISYIFVRLRMLAWGRLHLQELDLTSFFPCLINISLLKPDMVFQEHLEDLLTS